jgi:hypothetical protein
MINTFENSVFINCPFDEAYHVLLQCMLFTVVTLGFQPRIALEATDAGVIRLEKIINLINESQYSIHDLSRIRSSQEGEYYRLNMPYELGIDFGCRRFSSEKKFAYKRFLVLGGERYEYMKALSDISGIDIQYHDNEPISLVKSIRNWFVTNADIADALSPNDIWYKWTDFCYFYTVLLKDKGYHASELYDIPIKEQIDIIKKYVLNNREEAAR